ncbi:NAD(P)-binding protein [Chytriomyces sp. MP71]|nr:NAD(P)-binding protein [Chytriomyces sp. MP71]
MISARAANYSSLATRGGASTPAVFRSSGPGGRSSNSGHTATVFGCTGFLGRYVVNNLGKIGSQVITPYRGTDDERRHLKLMGDLGQIVQLRFDVRNDEQLVSCIKHSDTIFNLIGRNYPSLNFNLQQTHVDVPRKLARLAKELGVNKFVHVSALGANVDSPSEFLKTKALGEIAVREEFPEATIIRPSTMYGNEDKFWNRIGYYLKFGFVGLPVYNNGQTIMRPVYVGDVASAIAKTMKSDLAVGKTVELAGPRSYRYQDLIELFLDVTKRDPLVWYPPKFVAKRIADAMNLFMPFVQISRDEIERAYIDEVASREAGLLGFKDFGITPLTVEDTVLQYVALYRPPEFQRAPFEKDLKRYIESHQ